MLTQTSFVTDGKPPNDFTDDGGPLFGFAQAADDDDDVRSEYRSLEPPLLWLSM